MIDEKKLIEDLMECGQLGRKSFEAVLATIYKQPKVGEWIPCSERLPNDIAIHEVTARFRNGIVYTEFAYYDELREEWRKFDDDSIVNVIAWKETSEPYKE